MWVRPLERAFALAKTGRFRNKSEVARAMREEGYTHADMAYLEGTSLSRQIALVCAGARETVH